MKVYLISIIFLFLAGCELYEDVQLYTQNDFAEKEGMLFYKGNLYSGKLKKLGSKTVQLIEYKDGLQHGRFLEIFKNGSIAFDAQFAKGRPSGVSRGFYPSGNKKFEAFYKDGKYHGDYTQWYEDGKLYTYTIYKNGEVLESTIWGKEGKVYSELKPGQTNKSRVTAAAEKEEEETKEN